MDVTERDASPRISMKISGIVSMGNSVKSSMKAGVCFANAAENDGGMASLNDLHHDTIMCLLGFSPGKGGTP